MRKTSINQNGGDDDPQKKLSDMIAQSFKNWTNKPHRKETEEIDFSGQDNPIFNLLSSARNNNEKNNPLDALSNSILSPDYKPRSLSINSNGWSLPPHSQIQARNNNSGWDLTPDKSNSNIAQNNSRKTGEGRLIKVSSFARKPLKAPIARKKTMLDHTRTGNQRSPLFFPKFSAAFQPFKKRSMSLADPSSETNIETDELKKRDGKAVRKLEQAIKQG
mmetsp:Transcript_7693/g.8772  ORF Transcript_7693/g.8772 Transcript_7693/m.8772 type:complete len:219 (+) Transcript_7693:1138-1794(+)|eukprot:CAMPEP_0205825276 /NCGR_PEP_ID=MMETSP0206-20130828/24578_1 /ASSEMBLY_ACC=CAM_ASM_000279 /TAXON_ID=36767 /ORGANISM="Euplotes focardii, Strain TN1" /LENGTH=218 /DNA_ID=CAMNT_0053124181 /DNA_START=1134 /DNA_END=1790 /DNA_ORIENTATION=+